MPAEISYVDQPFVDALKTAAGLDDRLKKLRTTRKVFNWFSAANLVAFFIIFFIDIDLATSSSTSLNLAMMIFFGLQALDAHCEIRTLLMFRHLSALSKATTK